MVSAHAGIYNTWIDLQFRHVPLWFRSWKWLSRDISHRAILQANSFEPALHKEGNQGKIQNQQEAV